MAFAHHQPPRTTLARRRGNGDGEVATTSNAHVSLLGRTAKQRRTTRRARTRAQSSEGQPLLKEYDVLVVGGGPAGVSGAMRAAQLGRRVLLVDKPKALKEKQGGVDAFFGGPTGLWSKAIRDCGKSMDVTDMRARGKSDDAMCSASSRRCSVGTPMRRRRHAKLLLNCKTITIKKKLKGRHICLWRAT